MRREIRNASASDLMDRARAGDLVLSPHRWVNLGYFALSLVLASPILFIRPIPPAIWASTIFFGLGSLVFIPTFLPNAVALRLSRDGVTYRGFFRTITYAWRDVTAIGVFAMGKFGKTYVGIDASLMAACYPGLVRFNKDHTGYSGALDPFGLEPTILAEVMTTLWHAARSDGKDRST